MRVHPALMHAKLLFNDKRSRYNERRTDANRGDILFSRDKNQIHVHNHAREHSVLRVCDH